MKPAVFFMDAIRGTFAGFTNGEKWNGWESPVFTYDESVKILNASRCNGYDWHYDTLADAFVIELDDEMQYVPANLIEVGTEVEVIYAIGTGDWIWEMVNENPNRL